MKCAERENGKYISIFRLECEDMNSINQAHCYIVSIRGTFLIHQLSYKLILILYWLNWFCKRKRYWHNQNQAGFLIHLKFNWRDGFPILWLYHMFFFTFTDNFLSSRDLLNDDVAGGNVLARFFLLKYFSTKYSELV